MNKQRKIGLRKHLWHSFLGVSKGAVSILLMIVTTPFLTLTLFLVESVRYQDALELLFELEDLVASSTLANNDSFLNERFGLLAVDQTVDLDERYNMYMDSNISSFKNELQLNDVTATGMFPLSETNVFEQQIIDTCEISGVAEVIFDGLDLNKLFEKLNGVTNLDKIQKIADTGDQVMTVLKAVKTVYFDIAGNPKPDTKEGEKKMDSLATLHDNYNKAKKEVNDTYPAFKEKFKAYCDALATAKANCKEGEDPYKNADVVKAYNALTKPYNYSPKDRYVNALKKYQDSYKDLSDRIKDIFKDVTTLQAEIKKVKDKDSEGEFAALIEKIAGFIEAVETVTITSDTYRNTMAGEQATLESLLRDFDKINNTSFAETDWKNIENPLDLGKKITSTIDDLYTVFNNAVTNLEAIFDKKAQEDAAGISDYLALFDKIRNITVFYNSKLSSNINTSDWAVAVGADKSSEDFMNAVGNFTSACQDIVEGLAKLDFIKLISAAYKIAKAIWELSKAIVESVTKYIEKILEIISATSSNDNKVAGFFSYVASDFLVTSYACYNFSNRTNYLSTSGIMGSVDEPGKTGYSYKYSGNDTYPGNDKLTNSFAGDFSAFASVMSGTGQPSNDVRFKGAELEYILIGLENECQNQLCSFINMYLLRLAFNIPSVVKDEVIKSLASAYPPFTYAIYLLAVLIEPFLDMLILVNGGKVNLIKSDIFLSAKGILIFIEEFINAINAMDKIAKVEGMKPDELKKGLQECIKSEESTAGQKAVELNVTYNENMLLLLLLSVKKEDKLKRMQNLVQMEARVKNPDFKLSNAYTYIKADAKCSLKPMLNVGFANNGYIDVSNTRYLGY